MSKVVIELQKNIIDNNLDVVSILRKAKLISSKLNLTEFNNWIEKELNGYNEYSEIPDYRTVVGEIKAKNPCYGLIPVMMPSSLASELSTRKLYQSISEIQNLSETNEHIVVNLPTEVSDILCQNTGVNFPCYFIFGAHNLLRIIDNVKDKILEWCLKLEKDGILGENFEFNDTEIEKAKNVSQLINYYGPVINGNVSGTQISTGDNNNNEFASNDFSELINEIKNSLEKEKIDEQSKAEAFEILKDINESIKQNKKKSFVRTMLAGLKDFLINTGAAVTASLITAKLSGL